MQTQARAEEPSTKETLWEGEGDTAGWRPASGSEGKESKQCEEREVSE